MSENIPQELSFEAALSELEMLVGKMENGRLLQFLFLLMPAGGIHADKAETEIIGMGIDDKFGCAEDEENMSMQSHCVEK